MLDNVTDPDPLMSIGMFSRASLVSVKALRAYHEQGLLLPAAVDPSTGYRSYRVSQLTDAQIITRLRDLDVPLRDVAEVLAARDPEITRKVIAEHEVTMRDRLAEVTRIVDELHRAADLPGAHTPVHVRTEPAVAVLAVTGAVSGRDYAPFLGDAYGRLWGTLGRLGLSLAGPSGALYTADVHGDDDEPVTAFLPVDRVEPLPDDVVASGVHHAMLPELTAAVTHAGSYETVGETYRQLGAWVAHHATSLATPVRELYVVGADERGALLPDDQLRTEIVWPIEPPGKETP